jgi:hypothetical protein
MEKSLMTLSSAHDEDRVSPLVYGLIFIVLLCIPLRVMSYGYIPVDDAGRHAAKAVSGKPWQEILVMRPDFAEDSHPGWHWILGELHKRMGMDVDGLVAFEVASMMALFLIAPLFFLRRPEAWAATLLILAVFRSSSIFRISLGRPLIFSMAVVMAWSLAWPALKAKGARLWLACGLLTMLYALSTWIHCSWYLLALMPLATLLARQWRAFAFSSACFVLGVGLGALATGAPLIFLWQTLRHLQLSLGGEELTRMLVTEFQPNDGDPMMLTLVAILLLWRVLRGEFSWKRLNSPVFIMAVLCWVLSLKVVRFWEDWGLPALLAWMTLEFQDILRERMAPGAWRRLGLAAALCAPLFLATTSDLGGRWTNNLTIEYLDMKKPEHAKWLPGPGGIMYNTQMSVFYQTFYANPHGNWRYALGFEPGIMTEDNLKIYRRIQWNMGAYKAFAPWVKKLRPQDRIVIQAGSKPSINELEWDMTVSGVWIGRLPAAKANAQATTKTASVAPSASAGSGKHSSSP